jgi:hypothetical protein
LQGEPLTRNKHKSDLRGIEPGWYAMDDHGKLSSGPCFNLRGCIVRTIPLGGRSTGGNQLQDGC